MALDAMISSLSKVRPGRKTFLSVYLDLRPDGSGKKLHTVFLKSRLPEISKLLRPRSREQSIVTRDVQRLQKYLEEGLDPSWKGLALFVCSPEDIFLPIPMPLPPENSLTLAPFPSLFSLVRHADLYRSYAVLGADSRHVRLFLVKEGRPEKQISLSWEDKHTTRFGRLGWSLPKFQRHLQEHLKQRAKETVENLQRLLRQEKTEYLFTAAEEGMEGEIKKQLPASLKEKQIPLASLEPRDPDHKLLSGAFEALQKISREKAKTLARQILEEAQPLGKAAAGPEPTLSALQNHQAERLVFDPRFSAPGWGCPDCGFLGLGGPPGACPRCKAETRLVELREEMVRVAQFQGVGLSFPDPFPPLEKAGGVAALLKFKISAKGPR